MTSTSTATTVRYWAGVGIDTYDGQPSLNVWAMGEGATDERDLSVNMGHWDDRRLGALEATLRDAGFDLLGEWEIDSDGDLIREVRPTT